MSLFSVVVDGVPRNLIAADSADAALAIALALHGPDSPGSIEVCEQEPRRLPSDSQVLASDSGIAGQRDPRVRTA